MPRFWSAFVVVCRTVLSILLPLALAASCLAGTFLAFGPTDYTRPSGSPVVVTNTFSVLNPATQYTLRAFNGGMQNDQTELVSQTVVTLNGVQIINSTNFNSGVAELDIAVSLQATNTLTVELRGKPGGVLTIEVIGIDNDPPTIKATSSPVPNAAGWNTSNVTVTFSCSDATSGAASCPAPQTVTTEGSKAISGTATDNAGNTASTTITVNIDETAPTITASPSLAANSNGWNDSNVTVTFVCADSLSGVANCPSPITTSTEAANQVLSGMATDVAGNTASASATINLDKTPPTISITSPANGSTFTASSVSLTGSVSDSLSGVSSVSCNGVAATIQSGTFTCSVSLAFGSNTITAQATDLAGNSSPATTNIIRTNPPSITSLNPAYGPVGTSVTLTGSSFGATQGTSTITFNNVPASPSSWSDSQIVVPVPAGTSTGNVIVTVSGVSSNALSFTVLTAPLINSLSPTSGPVGTSVVVSGINFGATQASSTVTFNGISAMATSWSDTQIVVTVPSGAITGPILVTVAGQASNGGSGPTFAVGTPPTVSATVSPAPNANGWINTNAVVTFTCTAGSSPIATCPAAQTITSEGVNQAVSGTAADTDGTTASTSVSLNIDKTRPALTISSPADGTTVSSATVTVMGAASDSLSGLSSATCNGTAAPLSSGSFSCNISVSVGVNLIMVRVADVAGNVAGSNFHVSLSGTLPLPQSVTVTPATANLVVGQTQQLTAVDELGRPRPEATWSVSDPTIATISGDPSLTVLAPGQFTLTATVQGVSTQSTWNAASGPSLLPGTVQWSAPAPPPDSVVVQIVEAAPAAGGPELYSVEANKDSTDPPVVTVHAYTSDGRRLWSTPLNGSFGPGPALADGNGGILVNILPHPGSSEPAHLTDLDAQTGAIIWHYDESDPFAPLNNNSAIGLDGTVYAYGLTLDGATGALLPSFFDPTSLGQSSITINFSCNGLTTVEGSTSFHPFVPPPTIDGDGTRFSVAMVANAVYTDDCSRTITLTQFSQTSFLIRADSNGSVTLIPYVVYNNSSIIAGQSSLFLNGRSYTVQGRGLGTTSFRPVPDGLGGVFVPWWTQPSGSFGYQPHLTHVPQSGTMNDLVLPLPGPGELEGSIIPVGSQPFDQFQMVLGENNVAYASDLSNMIAFDLTSGQTFWSYATPNRATIIESLAGLGLAVKTTNTNRADTIVRLDSTGTAIADLWQAPQIDYIRANAWTGISPDGGAAEYYAPALQEAGGPGTRPAGDPQHNWTPDPGLVLVATQDCHKFNPATNIYARYPVYKLRLPSNKTKTPSTNYTVFEFVPANPNLKCVVLGGLSGLGPCRYADGSDQFPFNEFDDEISAGLSAGFDNIQYFLYGSPNQRFWGVKQIFRTLPDNALQPKQGWNRLTAKPQSDPLIDGQLDPWLAPWDGSPATCNSDFSTWFPRQ